MAYDFTTLQTEFFGRGFDHLNDAGTGLARVQRWLNSAMHEIDGEAKWPYLEATATGTAPVTVSDLGGRVESVYDTTNDRPLRRADRRDLQEWYTDNLDQTGTPEWWFRSGVNVINVYPVQTVSLSVRYWKVVTDLSAGSDTPAMPDRFRIAIVELALAKAHREAGQVGLAGEAADEAQRVVNKMREELLGDEPWVMPYVGDD